MNHYVAIDNVCAWPNLTMLPDGTLTATIFNQPCHGQWEGDVECWASEDGGLFWQHRGTPAAHEPTNNRMNVATGLAANGDLIVLASGWSNRKPPGERTSFGDSEILPIRVCRSSDGGTTWTHEGELDLDVNGPPIPFGDILPAEDGTLQAAVYVVTGRSPLTPSPCLLTSDDHGKTWARKSMIVDDGNHDETTTLHVEGPRWLAAARTTDHTSLDLFISEDHGRTWTFSQMLTGPQMAPAHLLRLADGRILLTYGVRHRGCYGIGYRLSDDDGQTWSRFPRMLVNFGPATDGGYPSSVQRDDGQIVTAWYAKATTFHHRYHMGVTHWQPDDA